MNVRTIIPTFALLFAFAQITIAQNDFTGAISFGSAYSSLRSDLFATQNGRMGFSAGLSFALPINSRLTLNPEVSFIQKGASARTVSVRPEQDVAYRNNDFYYNTFEANMLLGIQPIAEVPVRLQVGAFLDANSHRMSEKQDDTYIGDYKYLNTLLPTQELNNAFGGIDYGPVVGVDFGSGRFHVGVRYQQGLKNLYNYLEFLPEGHQIRTSSVRLSVSYFIF